MKPRTRRITTDRSIAPVINPKKRLTVLKKVQGIWENRKPDPIDELKLMRREWERQLPSLSR